MNHQKTFTNLFNAIENCDVYQVQNLLDTTGIDVNQTGSYGFSKTVSLLYKAVVKAVDGPLKDQRVNSIQILKLLLKKGANPNTKQGGVPVLHYAVSLEPYLKPEWLVVKTLLKHGADPNLESNRGHRALHQVLIKSDIPDIEWIGCVKSLLFWGANPNIQSDETLNFTRAISEIHKHLSPLVYRYQFIDSRGEMDLAAVREFIYLEEDERRIWATLTGPLRQEKSLPPEIITIISSFLFTPALSKYSLPFENWMALRQASTASSKK